MPPAAISAPAIPITAPAMNPVRLPMRRINCETGMATRASATQLSACGRVASALSVASMLPTSAVVDRIMAVMIWPNACETAR